MENSLIDWDNEEKGSFGYPDDRVAKLLASTQELVEDTRRALENGEILDVMRRTFEDSQRVRIEALAEWVPKGAQALAEEARRMVEIARVIDLEQTALHWQQKLEIFLEQCGGKDHFRKVFETLCAAGCLHRIANLIYAAASKTQQ